MHAPWGIPTCAGNGTFHYLKYTAYHISSGSGGGWGGSGGGGGEWGGSGGGWGGSGGGGGEWGGSGGGWGGSGGGWDCGAAILNPVYKMAPCVGRLTAGMRCTVGMVGH